ncbi:GNAT family N-acetyltransferase [Pyxidicoccus fallax]|uniref:GNAT family N-acetyltransferase n=1 Tax=Pyxidicoccus fallax TaxID=394095 RepID=A0A848LLQ0_9BACT|nr:GNAT family protein [Pyxidicoccus fallax]NMO18688.1 GNAT family N-acetyltransferase [Pyxidicoccus fallax]NPC79139.1 GNAT family N-acetyltransferase [Pyxidicoccus fallax]
MASRGRAAKVLGRGPRVLLRTPRPEDQEHFLETTRRSRTLHRPWVAPPTTPDAFRSYLQRNEGDDFEALLAIDRDSGHIAGAFNLSQIFRGSFQNAYLGYWAAHGFQGRGLMTEALGLVLAYAFRTLKLHRVEANIQPDNAASKALVARAGFRLEGFSPRYLKVAGRWRDHERWAITREEWPPR